MTTPPTDLEGRVYGPAPLRWCREKVAEFVEATGDDHRRWATHAPPGMAAAALFVVAGPLLSEFADASVIHGEQVFTWHAPLTVEQDHDVVGTVTRVRERSGAHFVTFELAVTSAGDPVVDGRSTFIVSEEAGAVRADAEDAEPAPYERGAFEPLEVRGGAFGPIARSASRVDLVRYAGATRDWNPIHWDHEAAVAAGLGGVVCHGLLQVAWMLQPFITSATDPAPPANARFRFRRPLRPGVQAFLSGTIGEDGGTVELSDDAGPYVIGTVSR